ncbi:MAG: hypothetical protein ACLPZR_16365 [Solirubrobacteraceae bacterium]
MNPLLSTPTFEQLRLLEAIYLGRERAGSPLFTRRDPQGRPPPRWGARGAWPIFQFVEWMLYHEHRLDARRVCLDCPRVSGYGWLTFDGGRPENTQPGTKIGLTIAGMTRIDKAKTEVDVFIDTLAVLIEQEREFVPSPTVEQPVELTASELAACLAGREWALRGPQLATLGDLIQKEPSTWNCQVQTTESDDDPWTATLSPFIRRYSGITSGDEYVERLVSAIAPAPPSEPFRPSSLSLPEAIDYLNAVWRVYAGKPLMLVSRAEAAAKLDSDCGTADEFESGLSALCGILGQLQLPDTEDHKKLVDLKGHLAQALDSAGAARTDAAIDDLRAVFDLRVWRQHPGTDERGRRGMQRLGIDLPTADWPGTWRYLQARVVAALAALREEIEALI